MTTTTITRFALAATINDQSPAYDDMLSYYLQACVVSDRKLQVFVSDMSDWDSSRKFDFIHPSAAAFHSYDTREDAEAALERFKTELAHDQDIAWAYNPRIVEMTLTFSI